MWSDERITEKQDLKQGELIERLAIPHATLAAASTPHLSTFKLKALEVSPFIPDGGMNFLDWWSMLEQTTTGLSETQKNVLLVTISKRRCKK